MPPGYPLRWIPAQVPEASTLHLDSIASKIVTFAGSGMPSRPIDRATLGGHDQERSPTALLIAHLFEPRHKTLAGRAARGLTELDLGVRIRPSIFVVSWLRVISRCAERT